MYRFVEVQASGNILDHPELLSSLDQTKASAVDIAAAIAESSALHQELDMQRQAYVPVAQHAACVYFAVADLWTIQHVYRFALAAFWRLFEHALASAVASQDVPLRIAAIKTVSCQLTLSRSSIQRGCSNVNVDLHNAVVHCQSAKRKACDEPRC